MATGPTSTTTMTAAMKAAFYRETFLDYYFNKAVTLQYGQKTPLPMHEGKTVDWMRYHELAIIESATTEDTYGDTTEMPIEAMNITATLSIYSNSIGFSTLLMKTTRDRDPKASFMEILGRNAGASMEWQARKTLATTCMTALRVDAVSKLNSTFQKFDVAVGRNNSTNTTTAVYLPSLSHSSGFWRGAFMTVKSGKAEGVMVRITAWNASADVATVSPALPEAFDWGTGSTSPPAYVNICQPFKPKSASYKNTGAENKPIRSGDRLSVKSLLAAVEVLGETGGEPFPDGLYRCFCSHLGGVELKNDSNWLTMQTNTARTGIETGQIGEIAGCRIIRTTLATTYDSPTTGGGGKAFQTAARLYQELEVTLVLGQNAFGIVDIDGDEDSPWDPQIIWNTSPDTYNKKGLHGFASWIIHFAMKGLNANYCVGIITYRG